MALSTNSIIHFTKTFENLAGILKSDFQVKYCFETISVKEGTIRIAVPMVSFCDIPLSQVKNHIDSYGSYGIGLSKNWAKKHGLNPVLYMERNSTMANHFCKTLFTEVLGEKYIEGAEESTYALADIFRYMKNYDGDLTRKKGNTPNYRFYDEREWRYVPLKKQLKKAPIIITPDNYDTDSKKLEANKLLIGQKLKFTPHDITYIIVESESEIIKLIALLDSEKGKIYPANTIKVLTSKIITKTQIISDL
jgi:hypothetical protein